MRSSSFISYRPDSGSRRSTKRTVQGVADFLRTNDKMASLLPAVARAMALQQDCQTVLPALFDNCSVLQFETGELVLATPNAALAAKLKQQLPKLQEGLVKKGWQVNAIRIKVHLKKASPKKAYTKQLSLPRQAISALSSLKDALEDSPRNQALKEALDAMLQRHRDGR